MLTKNKRRYLLTKALPLLLGACLVGTGGFLLFSSLATKPLTLEPPSEAARASLKKRTPQEKKAYTVPKTHPRKLTIKKLGVDAVIVPVGAPTGTIGSPASAWDVGWYNQSALPGSGNGALLIDGHVNDALNSPGVFYRLDSLVGGDAIEIERGDGKKLTYTVMKVEAIPLQRLNMAAMLASVNPEKEGLNLITCGGFYDEHRKTYDHRIVVFAVRT